MKTRIVFHTAFESGHHDFDNVELKKAPKGHITVVFTDTEGRQVDVVFDRRELRRVLDWKTILTL